MTDSRPLFQVGEEVILCSKRFPDANGEAVVTCRFYGLSKNIHSGNIVEGWKYKTDVMPDRIHVWEESVLRKKHKPSDQSLEDMIAEINKGVKAC